MNTLTDRRAKLTEHLIIEHQRHKLADNFKEIIYGGVDGIVTTFAIVAGFSGAALSNETTTQLSFGIVLLFGLANLFADAASMGLGNFLAVKSEQDLYKAAREKEENEVRVNTEMEYEETITIMMLKGYSEEDARTLADIYKKNETYWVDFMMNHELEIPDPRDDNPVKSGFITFVSFIIFGSVPIIPFMFFSDASTEFVFKLSILGTFSALIILGTLKWRVTGQVLWKSLFEVVAVGGAAALIAFMVGSFFSL